MGDIIESFLAVSIIRRAREKQKQQKTQHLKTLRSHSDPFELTEEAFIKNYRLPKSICASLIADLKPYDAQATRIRFETRFLAVLHFFGHGSYQTCVGNSYGTTMSQSSISRCIIYITQLLIQQKGSEIRFPQTECEQDAIKLGFYQKFGIKATIGAVDCTHIPIRTPSFTNPETPANLYMNRKGFYSINVEAICDHQLIFKAVNAKFPGSCHDSGIWTTSAVRTFLMNNHRTGNSSWLLGDQGYPLEPWLLTPFAAPSNGQERKFNRMHGKARNCIERAFGVLKGRFRCLSRERVLYYSHERAGNIFNACAILHNILLKNGVVLDQLEEEIHVEERPHNFDMNRFSSYREGTRVRDSYVLSLQLNDT